jgi:hypothetical protein
MPIRDFWAIFGQVTGLNFFSPIDPPRPTFPFILIPLDFEIFPKKKNPKRKKLSVILVVLSGFLSEFSFAFYRLLGYQTGEFQRELMRAILYEDNTKEVENFEFLGLQFEEEFDFLYVFVQFII